MMLAMSFATEFLALYRADADGRAVRLAQSRGDVGGAGRSSRSSTLALDILVERAAYGFRRMKPLVATNYDRAFWEVERYWKLSGAGAHAGFFAGTPFRPMVLRLAGARSGAASTTTAPT